MQSFKKKLIGTLALTAIAVQSVGAVSMPERAKAHFAAGDKAFKWAPKAANAPEQWKNLNSKAKGAKLAAAGIEIAPADNVSYLDMPDGSSWFVVSNLDRQILEQNEYYTDYTIVGVHATVYNDKLEAVGKIDAKIDAPEGCGRCSSIEFGAAVTKKFFNYDDNYELMLLTNFNPADGYGSIPFTKVFSLRGAQTNAAEVTTLPGYYMSAINNAKDSWSEDFFMEFFAGEEYTDTEMFYTFNIYSKAGYGTNGPTLLHTFKEDMVYVMSDGSNEAMPVMMNSRGSDLYVTCAKYEKTFMKNPFDYGDETINDNNRYIIDLYRKSGSKLTKVSTTAIPCEPAAAGMFMHTYSLGNFMGMEDISFDFGNDPAFVMSIADTDYNENTATSYRVYDTAGNVKATFGEGNEGYLRLSSVNGMPEQYVFLMPDATNEYGLKYSFCNWPEMTPVAEIPVVCTDAETQAQTILSMNLDRVSGWGSYRYAFSGTHGDTDEQGNTLHEMVWFDRYGSHLRTDRVNAGQNINLVNPLVAGFALNPYLFNTDSQHEYIYFALRRDDAESTQARTELCVGNQSGETLLQHIFPDNATQMNAALLNLNTHPVIWSSYLDDASEKYVTNFIELPLNKLQGEGTVANPYQIANPGDWAQIGSNLSAHYAVTADTDFEGNEFVPVTGAFGGTVDGAGHQVRNFTLTSAAMFDQLAPATDGAKPAIRNLSIDNVSAQNSPAIVAQRVSGAELSGIQLSNVDAASDDASDSFGTVAQTASANTRIENCGVKNLCINLPEADGVGGIVGSLASASSVNACAVNGMITAGAHVGGIVGQTNASTASVTNCHVDADVAARNNVGGLIGDAERGLVANNLVEGSVTATQAGFKYSEYAGGRVSVINAGGLIGRLAPAFASYDDNGNPVEASTDTIVKNNVVAVSEIIVPENLDQNAQATVHRIVGYSRINEDPEYMGENFNPMTGEYDIIWGDKPKAETGLAFNHAMAPLAAANTATATHSGTDGADLQAADADKEFFAGLGFAFDGYSATEPWVMNGSLPGLYFENSVGTGMEFNPAQISLGVGSVANVTLMLYGIEFDAVTIEVSDEEGVVANPVEFDEQGNVVFEIQVLKSGNYTVTATDGTRTATLAVSGISNGTVDTAAAAITFDGTTLRCADTVINLYSVSGTVVGTARGAMSVGHLAPGVYIAVAQNETLKIVVK